MIEAAVKKYGRIDILFNNAGVAGESLTDTTEEKWHRTIDIILPALILPAHLRFLICGNRAAVSS